MKEQQKRKFKQIHPEIEDGIDLRRCPPVQLGGEDTVKVVVGMVNGKIVVGG